VEYAVTHEIVMPLDMLQSGQWADIAEVSGEAGLVGRMAELGLRAGCRVQVIQSGRPCLLHIGGSRLSVRGDCATQILVRPLG
jgi:ferrous iron transport protein A